MPKIIEDPTNKILSAAIFVLKKVGREDLSMRQVAKKAGISVGTIYNYYPDKKSLLEAIDKKQGELVCKEIASYKGMGKAKEDILDELYGKAALALELGESEGNVYEALGKGLVGAFKNAKAEKEVLLALAKLLCFHQKEFKKETLLLIASKAIAE